MPVIFVYIRITIAPIYNLYGAEVGGRWIARLASAETYNENFARAASYLLLSSRLDHCARPHTLYSTLAMDYKNE